jgi:hypothetical protein
MMAMVQLQVSSRRSSVVPGNLQRLKHRLTP